jgi:hypothetical protein
MSLRGWVWLALALSALGWWYSPLSPRVPAVAAPASGSVARCPMPPRLESDAPPLQSPVPASLGTFPLAVAQLQPLAGFSVRARVLSREDYHVGRAAELSPTDLALGWGRMVDDRVLSQLEIGQSSRWYQYRWRGDPPLPPVEIARSSANMHMIPADANAAAQLHRVRAGDRIQVDGWLVEADTPDGWHWRSSLTRDDVGDGACEVVYVCSITQR